MRETRQSPGFWEILIGWADAGRRLQGEETVLFILTLVIGAVVGLLVVAFIVVTENLGVRMYPAGGAAWRRLIIPVLGSLITGFLLRRYFPNARGSGIPQTKTALFLRGGLIRFRTVVGKFCCSAVSLASGIALGREGPSVQVGAGIASALGRRLGLGPARIKSLVPIGASAALAAAFNTPIAAVLFTLEEVMGDLHAPVLGAIVLSSATSWMVLHLLLGDEPLFHVPAYQLVHPVEFLLYAVLGVVGGLVSVAFVRLLLWQRMRFLRLPVWTQGFQPVAGGLLVGIFGWFVPDVLGVGYNHVSQALNSQLALRTMAVLVALKLLATVTCYASGNAGGIFGPSLFIGAMLGGSVGAIGHYFLPDYTGSVGAYALVGMGTAFAGIIRVPLTSVIMIFEVTRDYTIIVPLMIANLISYFISSRLQQEPIYEALLHQDGIHLPPGPRSREDPVLVGRGIRPPAALVSATDEVGDALAHAFGILPPGESVLPVVDGDEFLGMISRARLEEAEQDGREHDQVARLLAPMGPNVNLTAENFPHVHPDQPLETAISRMARSDADILPVVSRGDIRHLVGVISLRDALSAYKAEAEQKSVEPPYQESKTPMAVLGGVLLVVVAIVAIAGFLNYFYRAERSARADQYRKDADASMAKDRWEEAITQYRNALSISHSSRDRLALAMALEKVGRSSEAGIYLHELVREIPNDGRANLGLARLDAAQGRLEEAVKEYHRAIYGSWPERGQASRVQARFELVGTLGKAGLKQQAKAELLSLAAEVPEEVESETQLGRTLLDYGLARESAQVFRRALQKNDHNADAYAGLAEAQLAQGDYPSARDSFHSALRLRPEDAALQKRLEIAGQLLAIDPALSGLSRAERYERSRKLVEAAVGSIDQCAATLKGPPPQEAKNLADTARKLLLRSSRPRSYPEATEENVDLAKQLWKARTPICGPADAPAEPLARLMGQWSR